MTAFRMPRDPAAFRNDLGRKARGGRREDRIHLAFIRGLPCLVCGSRRSVEAAHVRYASPVYAKGNTGMGTKPDDCWTVPLCAEHHRTGFDAQHNANEQAWWAGHNIDPLIVALTLHAASSDDEAGEQIISRARAPKVSV